MTVTGAHRRHGAVLWAAHALRAVLLAGAIGFLVFEDQGAARFFGAFLLSLIPRLADLRPVFDLAVGLALMINAAGNAFNLYEHIAVFDDVAHLITPMLLSPVAYVALARAGGVPTDREPGVNLRLSRFAITLALGLAGAGLWELFEWGLDSFLGTNLSLGYTDTLVDLGMGAIGTTLAGAWMAARTHGSR